MLPMLSEVNMDPSYIMTDAANSMFPSTLAPSVPLKVHIGLTIGFTAAYALLFFLIMSQLILILYYGHRRISYQSIFLFACLLWAALRTTLFSFYFRDCARSNMLPPFWSWAFFALPVFLQYFMLNILVLYFVKALVKISSPSKPHLYRKRLMVVYLLTNMLFLVTNISSSFIYCAKPTASYQQIVTILRVSLDYSLFILSALTLCFCIIKLTKLHSAKMFLEGQGVSMCQSTAVCIVIALVYISRAVYNIIAVSPISMPTFNFGWINVSDQGEVGIDGHIRHYTKNSAFVSFGIVLFLWELLPTFFTVWLFRVRRPDGNLSSSSIASGSYNAKSYFWEDLRRYDSDGNMSIGVTPPRNQGLLDIPPLSSPRTYSVNDNASYKRIASYGSIPTRSNSYNNQSQSFPSSHVRGTTPPLLFQSGSSNPYHNATQELT